MRRALLLITSICLMVLFAPVALADGLEIRVIDLQKIMQSSPQVTSVNSQLEKEFKPRQDKLISTQKDLQAKMDKLKRDSAVMKPVDRDKLENEIASDRASFQALAESFQQDVSSAQNKAMQKIMQQISAAVSKVATANKYDVIMQKSSVPYSNPKLDVTDEVMKALG